MRQLTVLLLLLFVCSITNGQESTKAVLLSINQQATLIDKMLVQMNSSLQNDRHKELRQQTKSISTAIAAIEKKSGELSLEISEKLFAITHNFKKALKEMQQLAENSGLFDKDKVLEAGYAQLKSVQTSLRNFLRTTYSGLEGQQDSVIKDKVATQDSVLVLKKDTAVTFTTTPSETSSENTFRKEPVTTNTTIPSSAVGGNSSPKVLDSIQQERLEMETSISSIYQALKKNQWATIGVLAKNISRSAIKIEDLVLLTKDEQKESIRTIAAGIRSYASQLYNLSRKGKAAHHQIHETLETIEAKFSTLSTGISILK